MSDADKAKEKIVTDLVTFVESQLILCFKEIFELLEHVVGIYNNHLGEKYTTADIANLQTNQTLLQTGNKFYNISEADFLKNLDVNNFDQEFMLLAIFFMFDFSQVLDSVYMYAYDRKFLQENPTLVRSTTVINNCYESLIKFEKRIIDDNESIADKNCDSYRKEAIETYFPLIKVFLERQSRKDDDDSKHETVTFTRFYENIIAFHYIMLRIVERQAINLTINALGYLLEKKNHKTGCLQYSTTMKKQ